MKIWLECGSKRLRKNTARPRRMRRIFLKKKYESLFALTTTINKTFSSRFNIFYFFH